MSLIYLNDILRDVHTNLKEYLTARVDLEFAHIVYQSIHAPEGYFLKLGTVIWRINWKG